MAVEMPPGLFRLAPTAERPSRLAFDVFDGSQLAARLTRAERHTDGTTILSGSVEGDALSEVMLVQYRHAVSGHVRWGDGQFLELVTLDGPGGAQLFLRELNAAPAAELPDTAMAAEIFPAQAAPATGDGSDDGSVVDVMIVYTDQARAGRGGTDQIEAMVREAVAVTNAAFERSKVQTRIRLVYSQEVRHSESPTQLTDLNRVTNPSDGMLDEVHALRSHYGADVVSLWVNNGVLGVAGIAWLGRNRDADEYWAFNVVGTPFAVSNLTFAHELGHNFGAEHDHLNATSAPFLPYAYGYQNTAGGRIFRTIMAYECAGTPCPRIGYYSSPLVAYEGIKVGDGNTDNARAFNQTRTTLARYRAAVANPAQSFRIDPSSLTVPSSAGTYPVEVTADGFWRAVSTAPWITIGGATGTGNGRFTVTVSANPGGTLRRGSIYAGPLTLVVTQNANAAAVCPTTTISLDTEFQGDIAPCTGGSTAYLRFQGQAGQLIAIEARSTDFDPALYLIAPAGVNVPGLGRTIATSDDYNGTTNPRIPESSGFLTLPATGFYDLGIYDRTDNAARGRFTISLRNSTEYCRFSMPTSLRFGPGYSPAVVNVGTAPGCGWQLESRASWARLGDAPSQTGPQAVKLDIDPLQETAPRTGEIWLTSKLLAQPLKLTLVQQPDGGGCADGDASLDTPVTGTLDASCGSLARGVAYPARRYRITVPAGQRLTLEARSEAFDPYLVLYSSSGAVIASNDDSGSTRNARLGSDSEPVRLAEGTYMVEVSGFDNTARGSFTLNLNTNLPAPAFESTLLATSGSLKVELPEAIEPALYLSRLMEVQVPAGTSAVEISADVSPSSDGLSLYASFGTPPSGSGGSVTADYSGTAAAGRVTLSLEPSAAGRLYVAFGRESAGAAVSADVSLRLTGAPLRDFRLLDHVMSTASPAPVCALPTIRADNFRASDRQATFVFTASATAGGTARVDFIGPDGISRNSVTMPAEADGNFCGQASMPLAGADGGAWKVRVYWDEREVFARAFTVSAAAPPQPPSLTAAQPTAVAVEGAAIYRFTPPADASRVTFRLQNVSGADLDLYVRAGAAPSTNGTRVTADFASEAAQGDESITIDGTSLPQLDPASVYYAEVIARNGGSGRGTLTAGVTVEPVVITRAITSGDINCSANMFESANFLLTGNDEVRLFLIGRVKTVSNLEFEFVTPAGQRLPRSTPQQVSPGPLCLYGTLRGAQIATAPNGGAGDWQARVYVNGELAVTRAFALIGAPPATTKLESGAGAGASFRTVRSGLLPTQYVITVPAGIARLDIRVNKKSSFPTALNLDLFVKRGARATQNQSDYSAATDSPTGESLSIDNPQAGDYYIAVQSPSATYLDISVKATAVPK